MLPQSLRGTFLRRSQHSSSEGVSQGGALLPRETPAPYSPPCWLLLLPTSPPPRSCFLHLLPTRPQHPNPHLGLCFVGGTQAETGLHLPSIHDNTTAGLAKSRHRLRKYIRKGIPLILLFFRSPEYKNLGQYLFPTQRSAGGNTSIFLFTLDFLPNLLVTAWLPRATMSNGWHCPPSKARNHSRGPRVTFAHLGSLGHSSGGSP